MPKKRTKAPSRRDLEALGAEKLSELLLDAAGRDDAVLARLQRELAPDGPGAEFTKLIRRQLRDLTHHDFVSWDEARDLAGDIDALREDIVRQLLPKSPKAAAQLLGEVMASEGRILEAVDDSDGEVGGALSRVIVDWGRAWAEVDAADPVALADLVLAASEGNDYGTRDGLVPAFARALGERGLDRLEQHTRAGLGKRTSEKRRGTRVWDPERIRLAHILRDVADVRGDPDLFVEAIRLGGVLEPYALEIGRRMLGAGRPEEALSWLADADECDLDKGLEIVEVKASALEALGRVDEAQQVRWRRIEACLDPDVLDAYLQRLPGDSARAETRAQAQRIALQHEDPHLGLWFLTVRGDLEGIRELAARRIDELDGSFYEVLRPAAEALSGEHPLPAAVLHRRMVESVLDRGRSTAYDYAARDVGRAAACARQVERGAVFEGHEAWLERLRLHHGRKRAFWRRVEGGAKG